MVVGYSFSANASNDALFFSEKAQNVLCPKCNTCLVKDFQPELLNITKSRQYDISYTDDLQTIVSKHFLDILSGLSLNTISYPIKTTLGEMFKLDIENVLAYDDIRRKVKYIKKCDECGNFEEVIGANPVFLKNPELFVGDLYKTDLAFGTGNRKEVLYLCSVRIAEILRKLKLRGLSLEPIEA